MSGGRRRIARLWTLSLGGIAVIVAGLALAVSWPGIVEDWRVCRLADDGDPILWLHEETRADAVVRPFTGVIDGSLSDALDVLSRILGYVEEGSVVLDGRLAGLASAPVHVIGGADAMPLDVLDQVLRAVREATGTEIAYTLRDDSKISIVPATDPDPITIAAHDLSGILEEERPARFLFWTRQIRLTPFRLLKLIEIRTGGPESRRRPRVLYPPVVGPHLLVIAGETLHARVRAILADLRRR